MPRRLHAISDIALETEREEFVDQRSDDQARDPRPVQHPQWIDKEHYDVRLVRGALADAKWLAVEKDITPGKAARSSLRALRQLEEWIKRGAVLQVEHPSGRTVRVVFDYS